MENSIHQGPGPVVQADIDKIIGEVTVSVIGTLILLGTVGFLAYQVGKAVLAETEARGVRKGRMEAEKPEGE